MIQDDSIMSHNAIDCFMGYSTMTDSANAFSFFPYSHLCYYFVDVFLSLSAFTSPFLFFADVKDAAMSHNATVGWMNWMALMIPVALFLSTDC